MVGRWQALELLTSAWDGARSGAGARVALISGEAGVGKTRLVSEFTVSAVGATGARVAGGCQTYTRRQPLHLISELVHDALGVSSTDTIATRRDALNAKCRALEPSPNQWKPYLLGILGLPPAPDSPEEPDGLLDDATLQKMTHAALQGLIIAARMGLRSI